jgi:hypothetical protein
MCANQHSSAKRGSSVASLTHSARVGHLGPQLLFYRVALMTRLLAFRLRRWQAAGLSSIVVAGGAYAKTTCPDWVVTRAGSAFNVAALISDSGSPQSALEKARNALMRVINGGGCQSIADPAACDETVVLAKKAIDALEACAPTNAPTTPAPQKPLTPEAENESSP